MSKKSVISWILVIIFVGLVTWLVLTPGKPGKLDAFATCLKTQGVKFYGAFWCPHCQAQKALFGSSVKLLPYIECSNPDGQSQNETCNTAKVKSYPTWEFPNGERLTGEQTLNTLATKSSCALPS
ncbi:hypothetical protein KW790_02370 [Candidatus Parcubacteria bacterium]|nr:hypothetical protein [Candidatus Parcubacteria bacterium]